MTNRIFLLLLLGLALPSPGHTDETPDSCAEEWKQATSGSPDNSEKMRVWQECAAKAAEQKKAIYAATRNVWADRLDTLPSGGWTLLSVSPDGTYAVFGSRRHGSRRGSVVAVWLRLENREAQSANGTTFKSEVERDLYDCERITSKATSVTYYSDNNLNGPGRSDTYDENKVTWSPVIPGTLGDSLLEWACRTPKTQPAKTP
jgi:hypothetical protein